MLISGSSKVALLAKRTSAESILTGLRNALRFEGLPVYTPPAGLNPEELSELWTTLEEAEAAYEKHLVSEVMPVLERKVHTYTLFETEVREGNPKP